MDTFISVYSFESSKFRTSKLWMDEWIPTLLGHFRVMFAVKSCVKVLFPRGSSWGKIWLNLLHVFSINPESYDAIWWSDCGGGGGVNYTTCSCATLTMLFQRERAISVCALWLRWKQSALKKERSGRPSWTERKDSEGKHLSFSVKFGAMIWRYWF